MQVDVMDPARARAFQVALGDAATLQAGDSLPPFFHQLYFWEPSVPSNLGRDGHPRVGGLIPDMGLPRRMWAGGRLAFHGPLRLGTGAEKQSFCEQTVRKMGRTGDLGIVTLRHEISQGGVLRLTEWQDLVYRAEADAQAPRPVAPSPRSREQTRKAAARWISTPRCCFAIRR